MTTRKKRLTLDQANELIRDLLRDHPQPSKLILLAFAEKINGGCFIKPKCPKPKSLSIAQAKKAVFEKKAENDESWIYLPASILKFSAKPCSSPIPMGSASEGHHSCKSASFSPSLTLYAWFTLLTPGRHPHQVQWELFSILGFFVLPDWYLTFFAAGDLP